MASAKQPILGVPTNIITGFLGVGKTSTILKLIANKPKNERWAVLVNEFGEIGVDGSLLQGQQSENQQIFIREVPGGCMCCAAGLPMQIALNQLLSQAKPDRLLIEPTGLGHPKEVLQVLMSDHYRNVITVQKNITLVDARKLSDARYTEHETFNQQIAIADTVVGNKLDLYKSGDAERLVDYVSKVGSPNTKVIFSSHGDVAIAEFEGVTEITGYSHHCQFQHQSHHHSQQSTIADSPLPDDGLTKATNQGEGFESIGWRFSPEKEFDRKALLRFFIDLKVERMKAVVITQDGIFGYNLTEDGLTEVELDDCVESRVELISDSFDKGLENQLLQCLVP